MDVDDLVEAVHARGGVAQRADFPRRVVDRGIACGKLVAPRGGLVALASLDASVLAAVAAGGVLSCASAAHSHGLPLLDPVSVPHVTIPRDVREPRRSKLVVHRRTVRTVGFVTTPEQTGADCARCLPFRDAVVVLDALLANGVDRDDILALCRGPGSRQARRAILAACSSAGSGGETVMRLAFQDAGIVAVPQARIRGVGRVDFLIAGWLVVEIDGYEYHSNEQAFANDRRRDAELVRQGYVVIRVTWRDAVRRPEYVVELVCAALAARTRAG
jgi:hypothetical protein